MKTEHQTTREEEAYWRHFEEKEMKLSEAARTVLGEAESAAYAEHMVRSYCFQPEEYEEAMEKMRLAATKLTDHECELLAQLWRAALAAAASIDADDFETLAGHRVYSGDLHYFYRLSSSMVEKILQEKKHAEFQKEIAERDPADLPDPPF